MVTFWVPFKTPHHNSFLQKLEVVLHLHLHFCQLVHNDEIGETSRHLSTRIHEHLNRDRTSHIFQHIQQSEACRNSCSAECFEVIDHATTKFQVKIKEALHISWEQPSLNKQLYHVNLTLSF